MDNFGPKVYLPRPDRLFYNYLIVRGQRPPVDLSPIREVMARYDLEIIAAPKLLGGNRSGSLLISTPQGRKVLKRYIDSLKDSSIIYEHSILTYLKQIDFPAPRLVTASTGEVLIRRGQDRYALYDFIEGGFQYSDYMLLPGQTRQFIALAGKMLANLHDKLKKLDVQGYNPDGFKSHSEDRWRNLEWLTNKLAFCVAETPRLSQKQNNRQANFLLQQAGHLEETVSKFDEVLKRAALPRLIIHADYGPYNLLFRPNAPAVILDFEMARLDWRVTELIDAWYRFGYDKLGFRFNKMKWLLDAYETLSPLTEQEWSYLPTVWKYLNIWRAIVYWRLYCETGTESYLPKACWCLEMMDWMVANEANFAARLTHLLNK